MSRAIIILLVCAIGCGKQSDPAPAPAAAGSGSSAPIDAAPPPPPDAAPPPIDAAAAIDDNPRTSELCGEVLLKIVDCHRDKQFLSALDDGVDAKRKAADRKHLRQIVKWRYTDCGALPTAIEDGGFLDNWTTVAKAPGILDSCAKLGAALRAAGGLFGGDVAN